MEIGRYLYTRYDFSCGRLFFSKKKYQVPGSVVGIFRNIPTTNNRRREQLLYGRKTKTATSSSDAAMQRPIHP